MSYYLNQGNERFKSDLKEKIYVDKSLLIKETNSLIGLGQSKFMSVTRPCRFGKTMALSMLNAYYSKGCNSKELFKDLKISKDSSFESHLNKHNVIWIDMASLYTEIDDKNEFVKKLNKIIINDINEYFPSILTNEENKLSKAIRKINDVTKATFIFLIDEWDVILRESDNNKLKDDYIELLRSLFKSSDTSTYIDLVYMTGILPIKKYNNESALNNFEEYTMLDSYPISEYMGFTKDEVLSLCNEYNMNFNEMKRWYDGYNLNGVEIYNPKSVVTSISKKRYDNYWISTSAIESVNNYIHYQNGNLYEELINLINNKVQDVSVSRFDNDIKNINSRNAALTLLIHLGYLAYDRDDATCRIPNFEIRNEMIKTLSQLKSSPFNNLINLSNESIKGLFNGNVESINKALSENHKLLANSFNKSSESVLGCIVLITFLPLLETYVQLQEVNSTTVRADIVYIPRGNKPAIIVELKVDNNEPTAIEQIKNNGYKNALQGYHGKVYIVGINYDNKTLEHNTLVEEIEIE